MSKNEDGRNGDDTFSTTSGIVGDPTTAVGDESLMVVGNIPSDPFEAKKVGDPIGDIILDNPVHWKIGDIIIFNQDQDPDDTLSFSAEGFVEHDVRAVVVGPVPGVIPSTGPWHMEIQSIDRESIDAEPKTWNLKLEQKKPMFEFKFVRFAYRYKYEDGEYSTISPYSELAFIPGEYDFMPKKGYNIGMTNRLRQLKIKNYVTEATERPADVVEIDILYKDDASPNIYVVETIKMTDGWTDEGELLWPDTLNGPNNPGVVTSTSRGEYEVTSELIHKAIPESQSLRHWDNVPRLAKAQSISANRLVYGNYVQNFNLLNSLCFDYDKEIKPLINISLRSIDAPLNAPEGTSQDPLNGLDTAAGFATPGKTVRSLRTYQIGVVYGDIYGRETPVLAGHGGTGSFTVEKANSSTLNKLRVDIATPSPDFAYYYKLFLKETTNEYYNLTMDRWYDAEDGNIWLSFASSDRNKVDIETSLILKKKHNSQEAVTDPARYKILAIENSAPDFIKTNKKSLGNLVNDSSNVDIGTSANGFPAPDNDKVWIRSSIQGYAGLFEGIAQPNNANSELTRLRNNGTLYVRVKSTVSNISSDWYQVSHYTASSNWHKFKTDKPFGDDMAFTSAGGDISTAVSGLVVELAEFKVENLKEFEGRFFVKIYKDLVLQSNLMVTPDPKVRVRMAMQVGYWNTTKRDIHDGPFNFTNWESVGMNLHNEIDGNGALADPYDPCGLNHNRRKLFFRSADGNWITGPSNACTAPLCCSANRAVRYWAQKSTGRFHIDNMFVRGHKDSNCPGTCCDNDCNDQGGCNCGRGIHISGVRQMGGTHMDLGYICNTEEDGYPFNTQADEDFADLIITPGTLFRWREDPEGLIYRVLGGTNSNCTNCSVYGRHHTWHESTDENQGNNKRRLGVVFERLGQPGIGFGGGGGYHPIGGRDYTAVAGRKEMGYWGGAMMPNGFTLNNNGNPNSAQDHEVPSPPGYGASINGTFSINDPAGTSYISTELDENGVAITVTKEQQLCRYRKHMSQFHHIEIVEPVQQDEDSWSTNQPAVWETEPKEDSGLDIYYEASPALPIVVDYSTNEMFAPFDSLVVDQNGLTSANFPAGNKILAWSDNSFQCSIAIDVGPVTGSRIGFMRPDGTVTYAVINERTDPNAPAGFDVNGNVDPTNLGASSNTFTIRFSDVCPASNNWYSDAPHNQPVDLGWHNAYAFGNGIESDRIRDDFNQVQIANGVKASTTLGEQYKEERRQTGLIHSGIYNSITGKNDLNQFLTAEKITKDMNPEYGSIQKLHTRDGDIVCMHEDKIMKVLADKDALYNADGSSNVALSKNFLGSDRPFATKYGISTNPESFATDLYGRIYFTDRSRGSVLRLSGDGITNISDYGMKDWFNDHLNPQTTLALGTFDTKKNLYNLSIEGYTAPGISDDPIDDKEEPVANGCGCEGEDPNEPSVGQVLQGIPRFSKVPPTHGPRKNNNYNSIISAANDISFRQDPEDESNDDRGGGDKPPANKFVGWSFFQETISFSEKAKGWVTFKSFFPESGLSINNEYYTWNMGNMYHHHSNSIRNNFYGVQYDSTIELLFNDAPEVVKSFTTLNYEGTQSRITPHVNPGGFDDGEYYNLTAKDGWYVEDSTTDLQTSGQLEFKNKEGKYFSYLKGVSTTLANLDEREFSVQGVGVLGDTTWNDEPDPEDPEPKSAFCLNIEPEPSCVTLGVGGCTDINASNYDPDATFDDGSCVYPDIEGCTNVAAFNYGFNCNSVDVLNTIGVPNVDDGCCCLIAGCTDPLATNYDATACHDDGSCIYPCNINPEFGLESYAGPTTIGGTDGSISFEFWLGNYDGSDGCVFDPLINLQGTGDITQDPLFSAWNVEGQGNGWWEFTMGLDGILNNSSIGDNLPAGVYDITFCKKALFPPCSELANPIDYTTGVIDPSACCFTHQVILNEPLAQIQCFGSTATVMHDAFAEGWYATYPPPLYSSLVGKEAGLMASESSFGLQNTNCYTQEIYVHSNNTGIYYTNNGFTFRLVHNSALYPIEWLEAIHKYDVGNGGPGLTWGTMVAPPNAGSCSLPNVGNLQTPFNWMSPTIPDYATLISVLNDLEDYNNNKIFNPPLDLTRNVFELNVEINNRAGTCSNINHDFVTADNTKCS